MVVFELTDWQITILVIGVMGIVAAWSWYMIQQNKRLRNLNKKKTQESPQTNQPVNEVDEQMKNIEQIFAKEKGQQPVKQPQEEYPKPVLQSTPIQAQPQKEPQQVGTMFDEVQPEPIPEEFPGGHHGEVIGFRQDPNDPEMIQVSVKVRKSKQQLRAGDVVLIQDD